MRPLLLIATCAVAAATSSAQAEPSSSNWTFRRGYYTHSPSTGLRVAQYAPLPDVAALPDVTPIRSGYRRSRVTIRGPHGSIDDSYQVENWGNGRGGLDAEWERFHDAWRSSFLSGGYGSRPNYGYGGYGGGYGPWNPGYGGQPGYRYGPRPVPYGYGYGQGAGYGPGGYGPNAGQGGYRPGYGRGPAASGADRPAHYDHDRAHGPHRDGRHGSPGY